MILGKNSVFLNENLGQFFCSIRKIVENHDLGKCYKIKAKLDCTQIYFGWYAYAYRDTFFCIQVRIKNSFYRISNWQTFLLYKKDKAIIFKLKIAHAGATALKATFKRSTN